jgi:hypothetical protein
MDYLTRGAAMLMSFVLFLIVVKIAYEGVETSGDSVVSGLFLIGVAFALFLASIFIFCLAAFGSFVLYPT